MVKAIIFDFFGVVGLSTYQIVADKCALSPDQRLGLKDVHKAFDKGFIDEKEFLQTYASTINQPYDDFVKDFFMSKKRFEASEPLLNYITELKKTYKIALLSNVNQGAYKEFIVPYIGYFDEVMLSFQVNIAKPDEAIYELIAQKMGLDVSECIMVDDNYINCQGAAAAGMQDILYKDFSDFKPKLLQCLNNV